MTLKTFKSFIKTITDMEKRCEEFNTAMENVLSMPFNKDGYKNDSTCMFFFPLEGIQNLFIETLVNEFDESQEGAEWFVYEGIDQILKGGTEVNEQKIKTFEEYYNWLNNN